MSAWLRAVPRAALFPVCAGAFTGLWIAHQEVSVNRYLSQGLWRIALWIASHDAMVGALLGLAAGVLVAAALTRKLPSTGAANLLERRLVLSNFLTAALALTISLLPTVSVPVLEYPARIVFGTALFLFWTGTTLFLLPRTTEETSSADSVEGVWTSLVWLLYLLFLAHVWARVEPGLPMAYLASGGLLGAVLLFAALSRPVRAFARLLGARLSRPRALRRLHTLSGIGLGLAVVLWASAGVKTLQSRAELKRSHPNLLIIAMDTTRADRISFLSKPTSGWDTTPNLRKYLAPRGTYFTRAHSQAPWTMPSFASVLTGLYPEEHGAQTGDGRLLPQQLTLAELLRERGYRTLAVVSGNFVSSQVGMLQGFDTRDDSQVADRDAITSPQVTDRALKLLATHGDKPFFMFVHYFDPHWKYQDHKEFALADPRVELQLPEKLKALGNPRLGGVFTPRELAKLKALYAEDIAFTDHHIGRLLAYLEAHRLWDTTQVVFVADHGDEFLEHGGFEHGDTVYEELVHVPLFVADPTRRTPARVDEVVETRWVFGTVLDILGVPRQAPYAAIPNLLSLPPDQERFARSSIHGYQACLTGNRYKLIDGPSNRKIAHTLPKADDSGAQAVGDSGSQTLLFDLLKDPGETKDLSKELPEVTRRLRSTLETINNELARREENAPMPRLSEDQKRKLRALGYL